MKSAKAIFLLCLGSLLVFAGCSGSSAASNSTGGSNYPSNGGSGDMPVQQAMAFTITSLEVPTVKVYVGEPVTVSALVTNTDDCDDSQVIRLFVSNYFDVNIGERVQTVALDASESKTISYSLTMDESDVYLVSIGELVAELFIYPLTPVPGEHGDGPFCVLCH